MLLLCVVNDCLANFSLAVQRHKNGRHTCGAHKLRIRRISQPDCLPVSIYLLFFLSACSQREATRLHFTRLDSRAYSLPAIHHFSWRWHFHLFQQTNTSNNNNVHKSIFYGHAFLSLFHSPFVLFLCWLRAVKFISFNINWQHENLFINCSFSLLYPVRELCEGVAYCVELNWIRE